MQQQPFEVDIGSLIEVLGRNLYSDPVIALRELVANARDSLLKRWDLNGPGEIRVSMDPINRSLTIADNGAGMGEVEIREGMARVAGSYTRLLRQEREEDTKLGAWLSGYFGLGFFASFMLARGVDVCTKAAGKPGPGLLWRCFGGQSDQSGEHAIPSSWTLQEREDVPEGTAVTLYLKPEHAERLIHAVDVEGLLVRYADLVEFPIYLEGKKAPVNIMKGPWIQPDVPDKRYVEFIHRRGLLKSDQDPLTVIPLREDPDLGGFLFLSHSGEAEGEIELHVRHIYVNKGSACSPGPYKFLSGCLDSRRLPLHLSRESVISGEELDAVQRRIREALLGHLKYIGAHRQGTLQELVRIYGRQLKLAALNDDELLQLIGETFAVRVGLERTEMTLGQIAACSGGTGQISFLTDEETQGQYAALRAAAGVPVVNARDPLDQALVHRFAQARGREAARVDTELQFEEVREAGWEAMEHILAAIDGTIQLKKAMLDENVVALFEHGHEALLEDLFRSRAAEGEELPERWKEVQHIHEMWKTISGRHRTLYLNVQHPLLKAFREACNRGVSLESLQAVGRSVIESARLYSQYMDPAARAAAYNAQSRACAALLAELIRTRGADRPDRSSSDGT